MACTTHGKTQSLHNQWTATDHIGAPSPFPCTVDPPQMVEVCVQWSHPYLAADLPGQIPPIDLPTAVKAKYRLASLRRVHIKYPAWMKRQAVPINPTGTPTTLGHTTKYRES